MTNNKLDIKFMQEAIKVSKNSDDHDTAVGCVIVKDNKIISKGYNHFLNNKYKNTFPKTRDGQKPSQTKYPYIIHAEMDAILKSKKEIKGSTIYVTLFPCKECAKTLIELGIKKIKYLNFDEVHKKQEVFYTSLELLEKCKFDIKQITL